MARRYLGRATSAMELRMQIGQSAADLVSACRAGDADAWETLLDRYERLVYTIAVREGLTREDAADVTQMTLEALLGQLDRIRDDSQIASWLMTVARRQAWKTRRRGDVLSLELDQTLVVLSACESGRQSTRHGGDEAVGLARSFLAAGAAAVIVSLWLTDDKIAAELMDHLYRSLVVGQRPAAALRAAQVDVCERHPHPADWAPFVVYGDH